MDTALIVPATRKLAMEEYRRYGVYLCPDPTWNNGAYRKKKFWDSDLSHLAFCISAAEGGNAKIDKTVPAIQARIESVNLSKDGIKSLSQIDVHQQDFKEVKRRLNLLIQRMREDETAPRSKRLEDTWQVLFLSPPDHPQTIHLDHDIENDIRHATTGKLKAFIQKHTYNTLAELQQARTTSDLKNSRHEPSDEPDGWFGKHLATAAKRAADEGYFSPETLRDERARRLREIVQRRGQPNFRKRLIVAYGGCCAVSGCDARAALEAVHIIPYCGPKSNYVSNGLLLRADIHTLFDLDLIGIHPQKMAVVLGGALQGTIYSELEGRILALPADPADRPNDQALAERWQQFTSRRKLPSKSS